MSKDKKIYEEEIPVQETDIVEEPIVEKAWEDVKDEDEEFNPVGTISSEVTYMRKEPMKSASINVILKKGDIVIISKDGDVGNYYRVTSKGKVGYVLKNDVAVK